MNKNTPSIGEVYRTYLSKLEDKNQEIVIRILINKVNHYTDMTSFYLHNNDPIISLDEFDNYFSEFLKGKPLEYIINEAYFDGDIYYVNEHTLIPRVETEEVIHSVPNLIKEFDFNYDSYNVIDACSGSGIMGISLSKLIKVNELLFLDIDKGALEVTRINSKKYKDQLPEKVVIKEQDLLSIDYSFPKKEATIIVSNPPYIIDKSTVDESVLKYEPHHALFTSDELEFYVSITNKAIDIGYPTLVIFEISEEISDRLENYLVDNLKVRNYRIIKDINGKRRILGIYLNA